DEHTYALMICSLRSLFTIFFFIMSPAPTQIYTLSLHDALPILAALAYSTIPVALMTRMPSSIVLNTASSSARSRARRWTRIVRRSEEHTSELQSRENLVCRLLLEKKK